MRDLIHHCSYITSLLIFLLSYIKAIEIKVISELPIIQDYEKNDVYSKVNENMLPRILVSNFSGPAHLMQLMQSCYNLKDNHYQYIFCPFSNMTQEESNYLYEPYKGIMGIWGEWQIIDNRFNAMRLIEGSICDGAKYRTTLVKFKCGKANKLLQVKEPKRCMYEAVFESPLVCGENAMLVYPRLPFNLQQTWDKLFEEYSAGFYTEKGYNNELDQLFIDAGYILQPDQRKSLLIKENLNRTVREKTCKEQVEILKKKVADLEKRLQMKEGYIDMLD